ncbi:MAG: hypothetical protein MJ168_00340 [Clostridia bacterium]|nr:hypothetical protein [Clostridia bacterium]
MEYKKPELKIEKFTFENIMGDFLSASDPTTKGPVIEENDPFIETMNAFGEVFNFSK